jgi:C1A family cysteine protease
VKRIGERVTQLLAAVLVCGLVGGGAISAHAEEPGATDDGFAEAKAVGLTSIEYTKLAEPGSVQRTPLYATVTKSARVRSALPTSYDMRTEAPQKVLAVRDQGEYGACWSFGATAVASASVVANGLAEDVQSVALSPKHLVFAGLGVLNMNFDDPLNNGGSYAVTLGAWVDRLGPEYEANYPYQTGRAGDVATAITSPDDLKSAQYRLDSFTTFDILFDQQGNFSSTALTALKEHIQQVGPLAITLKARYSDQYLPLTNTSLQTANHQETVVGWDDAKTFAGAPAAGAWLVQNSWGAVNTSGMTGGYHWVSYYDGTVSGFDAYSLESIDTDVNFNYAQNAMTSVDVDAANVFTAGADMTIDTVGISNVMPRNTVTVSVFKQVGEYPSSGTLVYQQQHSGVPAGIQTIDIPDFYLHAGEKFSVIAEYRDGGPYLEAERFYGTDDADECSFHIDPSQVPKNCASNGIHAQVPEDRQIQPGQSYFYEAGWTDVHELVADRVGWAGIGNVMLTAQAATLHHTVAEDSAANVDAGSVSAPIDVLANAYGPGSLAVSRVDEVTSQGGQVAIAEDGKSVLYTPVPGFSGTDTFEYSITGEGGTATAVATVTVANKTIDAFTPTIQGKPVVGQTLTVAGVPSGFTANYQWLRAGAVIAEAVKASYTLVDADANKAIAVRVRLSQINYDDREETSAAVDVTKPAPAPAPVSLSKAVVTVKDQVWTGKALTPSLTVKLGGKTLKAGTDYTVSYAANKAIGKATATIKAKSAAYSGSKKATFSILPKATKLTKATAAKKSATLTWQKASAAQKVTGYQLRYRVKGASAWKTKTYSAKTAKATIKSLKKGKKYEFQVRSYKTVSTLKYYSAWSPAKTTAKIK